MCSVECVVFKVQLVEVMRNAVFCVQFELSKEKFTVYSVQCAVCSMQFTVCNVQYAVCSLQCSAVFT